jgi:hypothetical protein
MFIVLLIKHRIKTTHISFNSIPFTSLSSIPRYLMVLDGDELPNLLHSTSNETPYFVFCPLPSAFRPPIPLDKSPKLTIIYPKNRGTLTDTSGLLFIISKLILKLFSLCSLFSDLRLLTSVVCSLSSDFCPLTSVFHLTSLG